MNKEVTLFLDGLDHPLRMEIEQLRQEILKANPKLSENIKWNGPNYSYNSEDRITMKVQPPKNIQLIFHRGAKVRDQPDSRLIEDHSGLLAWRTNDRAITTFRNMEDIITNKLALTQIVREWLKVTCDII